MYIWSHWTIVVYCILWRSDSNHDNLTLNVNTFKHVLFYCLRLCFQSQVLNERLENLKYKSSHETLRIWVKPLKYVIQTYSKTLVSFYLAHDTFHLEFYMKPLSFKYNWVIKKVFIICPAATFSQERGLEVRRIVSPFVFISNISTNQIKASIIVSQVNFCISSRSLKKFIECFVFFLNGSANRCVIIYLNSRRELDLSRNVLIKLIALLHYLIIAFYCTQTLPNTICFTLVLLIFFRSP